MTDWAAVIKKIAPTAKPATLKGLVDAMPQVIQIADLDTPLRQAHFLAQIAHESAGFQTAEEYASGAAYNGRKDLGNVKPGDGPRYKGRGLIQITGRANYREMGKELGQNFEQNPELAEEFPWAALTAAIYWRNRKINRAADKDDLRAVTRLINGGFNGLDDRARYLKRAKAVLAEAPAKPDVRTAQKRLTELSFPLGSIDGKIGSLTRSAIRDFQDAAGLPITGILDQTTYDRLLSPDAPARPVPPEREALTAEDLKKSGSKIVTSADNIKSNVTTAAGALAAASGMASQATEVTGHVQTIHTAVTSSRDIFSWVKENWQLAVIAVLLLVVILCIYRIWKEAQTVETERVNAARKGENVRV